MWPTPMTVAAREEVGRLIVRILEGLKVSPQNQVTPRAVS